MDDKEYVGFATLPNQVHRKSVKKGFDFTLMVAGESGLGKSTLVNSLFLTDMYRDRKLLSAEERITQTVEITKHVVDIEEKGVKLRLTIVDTPGFGDAVNNTECWKPVADYIDQQFEQYFRDESGLNRKNIQDNRVHCCLYFISPFGHGLRPLDVEFMRALHQRVNIVPILAKADTLTPSEVECKKSKIREEIEHYGIRIYQFPECDSDEDEDFKLQDQALKESIPFAVIGSNTVVEAKGRRVRGRLYPWGIVEVENPAHCDFVKLRTMLVKTHMQDLKDVTRETHYENYRAQCIQSMTRMVVKERNRKYGGSGHRACGGMRGAGTGPVGVWRERAQGLRGHRGKRAQGLWGYEGSGHRACGGMEGAGTGPVGVWREWTQGLWGYEGSGHRACGGTGGAGTGPVGVWRERAQGLWGYGGSGHRSSRMEPGTSAHSAENLGSHKQPAMTASVSLCTQLCTGKSRGAEPWCLHLGMGLGEAGQGRELEETIYP
ncbi:prominin-2 [Platysternon megacephalum]|uniref:Prominin-2 n=1 Tax=Platysternon megacephalum TaxID=55544 RepID=A0A4D9DMC7_9SAUR|nr:prominin-2 [Platysternon megacephalum]